MAVPGPRRKTQGTDLSLQGCSSVLSPLISGVPDSFHPLRLTPFAWLVSLVLSLASTWFIAPRMRHVCRDPGTGSSAGCTRNNRVERSGVLRRPQLLHSSSHVPSSLGCRTHFTQIKIHKATPPPHVTAARSSESSVKIEKACGPNFGHLVFSLPTFRPFHPLAAAKRPHASGLARGKLRRSTASPIAPNSSSQVSDKGNPQVVLGKTDPRLAPPQESSWSSWRRAFEPGSENSCPAMI